MKPATIAMTPPTTGPAIKRAPAEWLSCITFFNWSICNTTTTEKIKEKENVHAVHSVPPSPLFSFFSGFLNPHLLVGRLRSLIHPILRNNHSTGNVRVQNSRETSSWQAALSFVGTGVQGEARHQALVSGDCQTRCRFLSDKKQKEKKEKQLSGKVKLQYNRAKRGTKMKPERGREREREK